MADLFDDEAIQKYFRSLGIDQLNKQAMRGTAPSPQGMSGTSQSPYSAVGAPDESVKTNVTSALQGEVKENPDAQLGEGVGGTAGGLIGSIWGPIGQLVGKKVGKEVGGGIQEVFTSKQPWTDLSHRFLYNPLLAEPMKQAKNPMSMGQDSGGKKGGGIAGMLGGGGGTEGLPAYDPKTSPYGDFGLGSYKPGMYTGGTGGGGLMSSFGGGESMGGMGGGGMDFMSSFGGSGGGGMDIMSSFGGEGAGAGGLGSMFSSMGSSGGGFS